MTVTVAITGASGSVYAERLVGALSADERVERIYVVFSKSGREVFDHECPAVDLADRPKVEILAHDDFFTPIASGSNAAEAMVIVPCSMGTLGRVASGVSSNLIERAADVQLKEGLRLVLVVRETPLSLIHLRNMVALKEAGAVILPASPSFYSTPESVGELVDTVVYRILDQIGLKSDNSYRWAKK